MWAKVEVRTTTIQWRQGFCLLWPISVWQQSILFFLYYKNASRKYTKDITSLTSFTPICILCPLSILLFGNCSIRLANERFAVVTITISPTILIRLYSLAVIIIFIGIVRSTERVTHFVCFTAGKTLPAAWDWVVRNHNTYTIPVHVRMYANTGKTGSQGRQVFLPLFRDYTLNSANHPPQHDDSWVLEIIACKINSTLELCSIENRILWNEETTTCKAMIISIWRIRLLVRKYPHTVTRTCPLEC